MKRDNMKRAYIVQLVVICLQMKGTLSVASDARYLCTEDLDDPNIMHMNFHLTPGDTSIGAVYAFDAFSKTTPYSDCTANLNVPSNRYEFKFSLNMTDRMQITPANHCGFSFQSDTVTLVMRTFQNPALDTASDRFYVITCERAKLMSQWSESAAFGVGDVDTLPLNETRKVSIKMLRTDSDHPPLSYTVGDQVYLEFELKFASAIEGLDYVGASLVNMVLSPNADFSAPTRHLIDSVGCAVSHPEAVLTLTKPFIVNTTALVSSFVSRTSVFELAQFDGEINLYIKTDVQYCTRATEVCFETAEQNSARCTGARRKRSTDVIEKGYPSSITTSVIVKSGSDVGGTDSSSLANQTLESCTTSLGFFLILLVAVLAFFLDLLFIVYLAIRLRRVRKILQKTQHQSQELYSYNRYLFQ